MSEEGERRTDREGHTMTEHTNAGNTRNTGSRRDDDRDPIGTVAEEARKLFDTIQGRATRHVGRSVFNSFTGGAFSGGGRQERDVWGEAVAEPEDEYVCRACPFCRAIAAQRESAAAGRGTGGEAVGEVAGHLVAAGGELFAAFRQALDSFSRPAPRRTGESRDGRSRDGHGRDTVEHIDLG